MGPQEAAQAPAFVDYALYFSYFLVLAAVVTTIVLPLINAFKDPKVLVKSAIGIVGILILFAIGYALASGQVLAHDVSYGVDTESLSKFIGGVLITTYILTGISLVAIIYSEIENIVS